MPHIINLYERTIVFVLRMKPEGIERFSKYADLDHIVQNKILPDIDFEDDHTPVSKSIIFPIYKY